MKNKISYQLTNSDNQESTLNQKMESQFQKSFNFPEM